LKREKGNLVSGSTLSACIVGRLAAVSLVAMLLGPSPAAENSLADPVRVAPVTSAIDAAAARFSHTFPPWSVTILRLKTEPGAK
jgi:alpha-N-arabinofuranosidase